MFDLFEEFGISKKDLEDVKNKKGEKKADKGEGNKEKTTRPRKKKEREFELPIKICGGPFTYIFEKEDKQKWNEAVLKSKFVEKFPELNTLYYELKDLEIEEEIKEREGVKTFLLFRMIYNELTDDKKLEFPLIIASGETKMEVEEVSTLSELHDRWTELYPEYKDCKFMYNIKQKALIPYMVENVVAGAKYSCPVTVGYLDQKEVYTENEMKKAKVMEEDVLKLYAKKYPEYRTCKFHYNMELNLLFPIIYSDSDTGVPSSIALPVEIKAGGFKLRVSPEDLKGKNSGSLEEVRQVLEDIYPEYSKERTEMLYDKRHFIVPILKSSKKGVLFISDDTQWKHIVHEDEMKNKWRTEQNPFGIFRANISLKEDVQFQLLASPIPGELLHHIISIFKKNPQEEYAVQIFYDSQKGYEVYVPKQEVTRTSVEFQRNYQKEKKSLLVMDAHSHGCLPAFFSKVDDYDEKGIRLFMVLGNLNQEVPSIRLRAGLAGIFGCLNIEDIFSL